VISVSPKIPDEELLEDIRRCKREVEGTLTFDAYQNHGKFSAHTCLDRFGSWNDAKQAAGISAEDFEDFPKTSIDVTEDDIIEDIQRVAEKIDGFLSVNKYEEIGRHSYSTIQKRIGWNNAKRKAGLDVVGFPGDGRQNPIHHDKIHAEISDTLSMLAAQGKHPMQRNPELAKKSAEKAAASRDYEKMARIMREKWENGEIELWHDRGEDPPRGNKQTVECDWCGNALERKPSRIEQFEHQFCDLQCQGQWLSEYRSGEDSIHWTDSTVECDYCGDEFHRPPSDMYEHNFCSEACRDNWQSEVLVGENNPLWEGGGDHLYYGPNWPRQRKKALERDNYTCQRCGATAEEIGRNPDVHHINRTALENGDYEKANRLANLVCLCPSCHHKIEHLPVKIETVERRAS